MSIEYNRILNIIKLLYYENSLEVIYYVKKNVRKNKRRH